MENQLYITPSRNEEQRCIQNDASITHAKPTTSSFAWWKSRVSHDVKNQSKRRVVLVDVWRHCLLVTCTVLCTAAPSKRSAKKFQTICTFLKHTLGQINSKLNKKTRVILHVAKIQSTFSFERRLLLHLSITRTKDLIVTKQVG